MSNLEEYKASVAAQMQASELLVAKLVHENAVLTQQVDTRTEEVRNLTQELEKQRAQCVSLQEQCDKGVEETDVVKDLFEHLCGVRVHKSSEAETGLWFDTSQGSRTGVMDYKLGFVKGEGDATEVVDVPLLKERRAAELAVLQAQLPSYMFDTLSFPLKSLGQFYNKMGRCLNKRRQGQEASAGKQ